MKLRNFHGWIRTLLISHITIFSFSFPFPSSIPFLPFFFPLVHFLFIYFFFNPFDLLSLAGCTKGYFGEHGCFTSDSSRPDG
ncbi:hypothetical protein P175DRAFT_061677 [Aspergillus ochraceoroseus IBT 24754]|uniref:Uncharacterized protein n=1 Tax=Aspergillus ochraceoroseus IBT 24754 TaxID=1392256 RepID=A0A2T5M976_9EURO|nr:uncharacterized protein P175DRAFT_061677 [Aspergillus ochraceoroseus IBT 24754]PTU25093.1 hypothetical protein P175DRAFT_061677 [Aspergillus ochraceoroseus IBT 24754]